MQPILWSDISDFIYSDLSAAGLNDLYKAINSRIRGTSIVSYCDSDVSGDDTAESDFMIGAMYRFIEISRPKYDALLAAYNSEKDSLMKDVDTTNRSWYNDAPSSKNTDASGEDLTHLSTFSKSTSSSAYGTPMQRIAELDNEILNVYKNWADEFIREFSLEREY
jgi:hypothetical protein